MGSPLILGAGAHSDIPAEVYHGAEICAEPSISATGLKLILNKSPRHFWWQSNLNPDRPEQEAKAHFSVGQAAHDMLLLSHNWPSKYYVLQEDFNAKKTKEQAEWHAMRDEAHDAGKTVLTFDEAEKVRAMCAALKANPLAAAALSNGESEVTLCWQDRETGIWLRARPDFLPNKRRIIPDLKTAADASPKGFQRTIANFGYAQAAALYLDGIEAVFSDKPSNWIHVVMEKEPPHVVALYELPAEDIGRGRWLNRRAIRVFADCLSSGKWPGYADEPVMLGLPGWERKVIDDGITPEGVAWGDLAAA